MCFAINDLSIQVIKLWQMPLIRQDIFFLYIFIKTSLVCSVLIICQMHILVLNFINLYAVKPYNYKVTRTSKYMKFSKSYQFNEKFNRFMACFSNIWISDIWNINMISNLIYFIWTILVFCKCQRLVFQDDTHLRQVSYNTTD